MVLVEIGTDVSVFVLRGDQFLHGFIYHGAVLGGRRITVALHGRRVPFTPEFGAEAPISVRFVAERLYDPFDVLGHQPVVDAQVEFFAQVAAEMGGSVSGRFEHVAYFDRGGRRGSFFLFPVSLGGEQRCGCGEK